MSHPSNDTYTRIVLATRPVGDITPSTFRTERHSLSSLHSSLPPRHVLLHVAWLSVDPAMRGWLNDVRSYTKPVGIGETMRASGLGVVIQVGEQSAFKVGEVVHGLLGWTEYAVLPDDKVEQMIVPPGAEPIDFLHPLGLSGLTAYFGLYDVGNIKPTDTLLVSGAAGSVGSLVCQMGLKVGARVVGIAGSDAKCAWLEKEVGVHRALNYKDPAFREGLKSVGWIDVYFDNVGGEILDLVLRRLNKGARIVLCGAISDYNKQRPTGLTGYLNLIGQRAKIEGFVVMDYRDKYPTAIAEISKWISDGSLKRKYHVVEGLESAPTALPMLFTGENTGKLVVKVSDILDKNAKCKM